MKCKIPEISWHNRDPVLSVDIQPKSNSSNSFYRLASGGTDAHVLLWYMKLTSTGEYGDIELDLAADLTRHQRAVNVVKWSPSGELLASGDDESVVFIWKQKSDNEPLNILDSTNDQDKEVWITLKILRGHMEDIYDLCWAPNSLYLVSGSVDNSAMVWDVQKGKSLAILNDHKGFVQGVAWDPKNQYIATLSTDRYMRIFDIQTKKVLHRVNKATLPVPEDNNLHGKRMRLFHDDTLQTFFRRLCFTPDGKLLLTPAGTTDYDGCTIPLNTTYVFSRYAFRQPAIVLPCPDQYTVAVKCCPLLYKLRPFNEDKNPPVVPLPYRMIFAVASKSSVYFYDTQQKQPFALISNIHYTRLTDITWSNDGRIVVVSSTDGFCSLITFEKDELGEEYENSEATLEAALAQVTKKSKKQKDSEVLAKSRKSSTDDTTAIQKEATILQKDPQMEAIVEQEKIAQTSEIKCESNNPEKTTEINEDIVKSTDPSIEDNNQGNEFKEKVEEAISMSVKSNTESKSESKPMPELSTSAVEETCEQKSSSIETTTKETTPSKKAIIIPSKGLSGEIILDKEILSSDEKFETPEKKTRCATPISIRRHPRTPSNTTTQTPTSMSNILKSKINQSPVSSLQNENCTTLQDKKAKPIAVRRVPRAIINTPVVNTSSLVEEAMDAWPLDTVPTKENMSDSTKKCVKEAGIVPLSLNDTTCERTEDIRLVYEETNEENSLKETITKPLEHEELQSSVVEKTILDTPIVQTPSGSKSPVVEKTILDTPKVQTPSGNKTPLVEKTALDTPKVQTPSGNKTPRRVALKTISTPKSKKKLLD